jgi:hypothetical protein
MLESSNDTVLYAYAELWKTLAGDTPAKPSDAARPGARKEF